ncbi:MAG: Gfo/Idh/MocA family oxidoreductase [Clostridia bacterium]|nr:Gfo/Idh/MocA family oxidoreductase [Clostridia bacterium]
MHVAETASRGGAGRPLRVGIIGTGFGARVQAPLFGRHPAFEVAAVASVARGDVERVRRESGVERVLTDWRALLEEPLDLVSVTSDPAHHKEMVLAALERGHAILCEKPMALDAGEAEEMVSARERAGRPGWIDFEFRFRPARQKTREILASGRLGRILHVSYIGRDAGYHRLAENRLGWLGRRATGGGVLGAVGSHAIDALRWWLGDEFASLEARLITHVPEVTLPDGEREVRDADDAFQVIGETRSGIRFEMAFVRASRHLSGWRLEVLGSEGTLVMRGDRELELGLGDEPLRPVPLEPTPAPPADLPAAARPYWDAFPPFLDHLARALRGGEEPGLARFEDGLAVQRVMDAVREAAETGRRVMLPR